MSKLRKRAREHGEPRYTIPQRSIAHPIYEVFDMGWMSLPLGLQQELEQPRLEPKEAT